MKSTVCQLTLAHQQGFEKYARKSRREEFLSGMEVQVYIAGDLALKHSATLHGSRNSMSPERYASFVAAESTYWDAYQTAAERAFHTLRLLERAIRQLQRFKNPAYARITLACFFRRLFLSRKQRLKWWKTQSWRRDIPKQSFDRKLQA